MSSENGTVVFYGAGGYAKKRLDAWVEKGLIPVCFVDADTKKHYTWIESSSGTFEVLPLLDCIEKYPDFTLYLSVDPNIQLKIRDYLLELGIENKRILFTDEDEWRLGCDFIGKLIVFTPDFISTCCVKPDLRIKYHDNFEDDLEAYNSSVLILLENIKMGRPTPCDNCPKLIEGWYKKKPKPENVIFSSLFSNSTCNFQCFYCQAKDKFQVSYGKSAVVYLNNLAQTFPSTKFGVGLSDGEPTLNPELNEILDLVEKQKWTCSITSNASVYNAKIASLLRQGRLSLHVSLDSGTAETFAFIKGMNLFDRVVGNLKKYGSATREHSITFKYIILDGINDNNDDIDGFLEVAAELNARVHVANDAHYRVPLSDRAINACVELYQKAIAKNLKPEIIFELFIPVDRKRIQACLF